MRMTVPLTLFAAAAFLLLASSCDAWAGVGHARARRAGWALASAPAAGAGESGKIKLPIVQIIDEKQELVGEFICGNDLTGAVSKLRAVLTSLAAASPPSPSDMCDRFVSNVYSDEQLQELLARGDKLLILKVYRDGCKKCATMETTFLEFTDAFVSPRFKWLQAEVANIPAHTSALKERLKGAPSSPSSPSS